MKRRIYGKRKRRLLRRLRWLWAWSVVISAVLLLGVISLAAAKGIGDLCDGRKKENPNHEISEQASEQTENEDKRSLVSDAEWESEDSWSSQETEDLENTEGMSEGLSALLVNKSQYLPTDYEVPLTTLKNGQQVASVIYKDLRNMLFDGEEEQKGLSFLVASGYRSSEEQQRLLEAEIIKNIKAGMDEKEARADALLTVAPSHYSEHETGLAVDIVAVSNQRMDETQESTAENIWLRENCYKYGFILRYPKEKEEVTGFSYESWHFRYVGKEAAKKITEQGITLEEYLQQDQ
ncbi:MAG: M15 family metallopeptidase [Lachnospiraceae bacterium]|nr:M15 family metallopeptidase [Lachnospiraceae bacterium]